MGKTEKVVVVMPAITRQDAADDLRGIAARSGDW